MGNKKCSSQIDTDVPSFVEFKELISDHLKRESDTELKAVYETVFEYIQSGPHSSINLCNLIDRLRVKRKRMGIRYSSIFEHQLVMQAMQYATIYHPQYMIADKEYHRLRFMSIIDDFFKKRKWRHVEQTLLVDMLFDGYDAAEETLSSASLIGYCMENNPLPFKFTHEILSAAVDLLLRYFAEEDVLICDAGVERM